MTTFNITAAIHDSRFNETMTMLRRLSARAEKLGLPAFEISEAVVEYRKAGKTETMERFFSITVSGHQPVMAGGWHVLARLESMEAGEHNLIRGFGADALDVAYRTKAHVCEHCNTKRNRKASFVIQNEAGKQMQVATSCIADFAGHENPADLLYVLDGLSRLPQDLQELGYPEDGENGQGRAGAYVCPIALLRVACELVKREGYVTREKAETQGLVATADAAVMVLCKGGLEISHAAHAKAEATLNWAREQIDARNTYLYNVGVVACQSMIDLRKHAGLLISAVVAYDRAIASEQPKTEQVYVGLPSEKLVARKVVYTGKSGYMGEWGWITIARFQDVETGGVLVWKTSAALPAFKIGETYAINATVKEHNEYRDEKQTLITRAVCKDLDLIDAVRSLTIAAVGGEDAKAVMRQIKAIIKKAQYLNTVNDEGESMISAAVNMAMDEHAGWEPVVQALVGAGCDTEAVQAVVARNGEICQRVALMLVAG